MLTALSTALLSAADEPKKSEANTITVEAGTATFYVGTNISAISVKGKSTALQGHAVVKQGPEGLTIEQIEASVPVKTLNTGMGLRDEHMRKYIFNTSDGNAPDVRFEAAKAVCPPAGSGHESTCQLAGNLTIRGVARPFTMALKVRDDSQSYHAAGDGVVKLSDYGIEQPSQFGVKTANEVQLHLEFAGKATTTYRASAGGR